MKVLCKPKFVTFPTGLKFQSKLPHKWPSTESAHTASNPRFTLCPSKWQAGCLIPRSLNEAKTMRLKCYREKLPYSSSQDRRLNPKTKLRLFPTLQQRRQNSSKHREQEGLMISASTKQRPRLNVNCSYSEAVIRAKASNALTIAYM